MINYKKFEDWVKNNKITSAILILLFCVGIITQTTDLFHRLYSFIYPDNDEIVDTYEIVDIHLDWAFVTAEIFAGFAFDSNKFRVKINGRGFEGKDNLFQKIEQNPNQIYLIRLAGTTPIDGLWIGGTDEQNDFSIEFVIGDVIDDMDEELYGQYSKILHFPPIEELTTGWNSFSDSVASCCENYFKLIGFFRFVHFRDKGDWDNQYKVQIVTPDPDKAARTLKELETDNHLNKYIEIKDQKEFIELIKELKKKEN